jgi:CHAD domain-containing protein
MAKARQIPNLDPEQNLKICLPKILSTRFSEMNSFERRTIEGKDIEALHNMRVASRRLQAVLKVFRAYFPSKKYSREYMKLKTLIRALGEVRHFDVLISHLEKYRETLNEKDRKTLDMLIVRQKSLRAAKRRALLSYIRLLNRTGYKEKFSNFILSV